MNKILNLDGRVFEDSLGIIADAKKKGVSFSEQPEPYKLRLFLKGELPLKEAQKIGQISVTTFDFNDGTNPSDLTKYYMEDTDYVLTINDSEKIIGYAAGWAVGGLSNRLHHFGGAAVSREHQGRGLYSLLNKTRLIVEPAQTIQTRTGNPKVVSALKNLAKLSGHTFYPNDDKTSDYVKAVIDWYYDKEPIRTGLVDPSTLIWPNCYPDGTDGQLVYLVQE